MIRQMKSRNRPRRAAAFTLFELVVVLAIIAALAAVVLPFSRRSNDALKMKQHSSSMAQMLRYAVNLAEDNDSVRFVFDSKNMSYSLRMADDSHNFKQSPDFAGAERFLDRSIYLFDIEGFEQAGAEYLLTFDARMSWPQAHITLCTRDVTETIRIDTKNVVVEEKSI
jgi:prepilin-type N-terminal cleavage/methylation domain-containing protein